MFNIDPDNHFHASIPTDTKYYSDEQFVRDVKSKGDLSFIHFNARSLKRPGLKHILLMALRSMDMKRFTL